MTLETILQGDTGHPEHAHSSHGHVKCAIPELQHFSIY